MKYSLRVKLTIIFVSLLAVTLLAVYYLNSQFLDDFYYRNKMQTMVSSYETIDGMLKQGTYTRQELVTEMDLIRDKHNISILYFDADRIEILGNYSNRVEESTLTNKLKQYLRGSISGAVSVYTQPRGFENRIVYSGEYLQIWETEEAKTQSLYLESWGFFNDHTLFVMTTPMESIQESVRVANTFLAIAGGAVLVLAVVVLLLITRRVTKPILELAEVSEKVSQLDFQKRYSGKEQDEIGILGNSINSMADRLQETIEELQSANEQLKRDIQEKIQIDEMRKEFLSNVSHELKTPIALIQGYAEGLIESVNDSPESRDYYCEVIADEADKMNKMVRKLLTLNQMEFGQEVPEMTEFDIVALVRSVLESNAISLRQKGAQLQMSMPEAVPVLGDEFKIEEVMTNYLSNALNHLDYEKRIEVLVEEKDACVRVSVFNTGDPIPEEDLAKVWEKFYKVDKAHTREYGGSGIGLSIVRAIMESLGQAYGVRNREDGVEFWFELSRSEQESDDFQA